MKKQSSNVSPSKRSGTSAVNTTVINETGRGLTVAKVELEHL